VEQKTHNWIKFEVEFLLGFPDKTRCLNSVWSYLFSPSCVLCHGYMHRFSRSRF